MLLFVLILQLFLNDPSSNNKKTFKINLFPRFSVTQKVLLFRMRKLLYIIPNCYNFMLQRKCTLIEEEKTFRKLCVYKGTFHA